MRVWFVELLDKGSPRVVPSTAGEQEDIPGTLAAGYFIGDGFRVWVRASSSEGAIQVAHEAKLDRLADE